jgi:uncharacterized membrane protein
VAALAALGLGLSAYLTYGKLAGASTLWCEAGSGCAAVQASHYATFLGLPTAAWGAAVFAAIGALALAGLTPRRWTWAFVLAVVAVSMSAYLTWISLTVLGTTCPWCLAVAATDVALLGVLVARRPVLPGRRAPTRPARLAWLGGATAVLTVAGAAAVFVGTSPADAAYRAALARHLATTGAVMYGAYWCPACSEQKARFGREADLLPYVECDPRGLRPRPDLCERAGVRRYPTWIIGGQRYEGVLSLEELARASAFSGAAAGR